MKKNFFKAMASALILTGSLTASAVDSTPEPIGWKFELMPYLWYAGMEGTVKVRGEEVDFDKSASDLFDAVEVGGSMLAVIQKDRYLFWGQVDYFNLDTNQLDVKDRPARGSLETKTLIMEGALGYQIDGWSPGQTFDLLVGVRHTGMKNDLKVNGIANTFEKKTYITDPIFLVRPSFPLFPSKIKGLRFNPVLGAGGGGDSEFIYELFPQVQYHFTEHVVGRIGYRTLGWRLEGDRNNELDVSLSGMIIGLGATW